MTNKKTVKHGLLTFRPLAQQWNEHCMKIDWSTVWDWNQWFESYIIVIENNNHLHVSFDLPDTCMGLDSQHFRRKFVQKFQELIGEWNINSQAAVNMKWSEDPYVYHRYVCKNFTNLEDADGGDCRVIVSCWGEREMIKFQEEYIMFSTRRTYKMLDFEDYCREIHYCLDEDILLDTNTGIYSTTFNSIADLEYHAYINMLKKKYIYRGNALLRKSAIEQICLSYALTHFGCVINMPI